MADQHCVPDDASRESQEMLRGEHGPQSFVENETLPTDMRGYDGYEAKAVLEAAGVRFLGVVEGDEIFQYVELPEGWNKVGTEPPFRSQLVDAKGNERGRISFKPEYWDRRAHINLTRRFGPWEDYDRKRKENVTVVKVVDYGRVLYITDPIQLPEGYWERRKIVKKSFALATSWLDKNHPDWRDPNAYRD